MEKIKNLYNSRLSLLGAKPGVGKVDFAINLIQELAIKNNKSILFFGFDGPANWYIETFLASMLNVNYRYLEKYVEPLKVSRDYNIAKIKEDEYFKALEKLYKSEIYMHNKTSYFPNGILDYIKYFKSEYNLDLIVIDNLEILNNMYGCENEEDLEILIQKLEKFSFEQNVPILILTSLDYKKSFIKINLLDNFKYSENILKYFNVISLLDSDYITSKKIVYKELYIIKDNKVDKLNIKHNRETKQTEVVEIEIEN